MKRIKRLWNSINDLDTKTLSITLQRYISVIFSIFVVTYLLLDIVGKAPLALHINLVMLSATLGGLVFAGASFTGKPNLQKRMMAIARLFIWATVLFIIFYLVFSIIGDKNIELFKPQSADSYVIFILWWVATAGIYGGSYLFSYALLKFVLVLRELS